MRQDQFEALQDRIEQLVDVFVKESDPTTWPGVGKKAVELTRDERGDLYWSKRSAAATLSVALRLTALVETVRARSAGDKPSPGAVVPTEDDLDEQVQAGERQAAALMKRLGDKSRGTG